MGFTVYYQSTGTVSAPLRQAVAEKIERLSAGRNWNNCEPPALFGAINNGEDDQTGVLLGSSKPSFLPTPGQSHSTNQPGTPDGTIQDVVEILCEVSNEFGIDWQFSHDHDAGPVGFIRDGQADVQLSHEINNIASLGNVVADALDNLPVRLPSRDPSMFEDENGDPKILKFGPLNSG